MDSFDLVTVGDAKVDIILDVQNTNKHFRLNEGGEICIKSGDKASIDSAYFMTGGNAANVAVGTSRMGLKSAIIAEIGKDEFAQKIISTLNAEKVSEKFLKKTESSSSFSVIINYKKERTIFTEHVKREHDFSFEDFSAGWVYLTSMGDVWENAYKKTLEYAIKNNSKFAFNPGTKQIDNGISGLKDFFLYSQVVFLNKEEAAKICGLEVTNDENLVNHLLEQIKKTGAKIAVITDGGKGAYMIDEKGSIHFQQSLAVEVVERTGSGDAFASGFLSAVLFGLSSKDAMRWGAKNAGSVISKIGAQAGLLTKKEIEDYNG